MKKRTIMYIERKAGSLEGPARIGWVTFSKTGRTIYYKGQAFQSLKGSGYKCNYFDVKTGDEYWISGVTEVGYPMSKSMPMSKRSIFG